MNNEKNKLVNFPDINSRQKRNFYPEDEYEEADELEEFEDDENLFEEDFEENFSEEDGGVSSEGNKKSKKSKKKQDSDEGNLEKKDKTKKKTLPKKTEPIKKEASAKGEITKKILNSILSFIKKNPYVLIIFLVFAVFLLFAVYLLLLGDSGSGDRDTTKTSGITASKCSYNISGINEDTTIELINCEATKDNYQVLERISLEKYIAGVALAEMGEDYIDEAMKAQLVAVRSYTLTRDIDKYGVGYDESANVIRMRACENDQVYWDYEKDIYRSANAVRNGVSKYSPEYTPAEGETPWKKALSEEAKRKYEALVSDVVGKYVVSSSGSVVATGYVDTTTQKFKELAVNNSGTKNGEYEAILMNVYPEVTSVESAECSMMYYADAGDYSNWKQQASLGAPWADVVIGYDSKNKRDVTIDSAGCLITSIAMQIVHSGIPTGNITDFNPGTFAKALDNAGILSPGGGINSYANIENVIPGFKYMGQAYPFGSNENRYEQIRTHAENGYYIVIEVRKHNRDRQHWVALDVKNSAAADWKELYIWDPATTKTSIGEVENYRANRIVYFKAENTEGN